MVGCVGRRVGWVGRMFAAGVRAVEWVRRVVAWVKGVVGQVWRPVEWVRRVVKWVGDVVGKVRRVVVRMGYQWKRGFALPFLPASTYIHTEKPPVPLYTNSNSQKLID